MKGCSILKHTINEEVYSNFDSRKPELAILSRFDKKFKEGNITVKEKELWSFVLHYYGNKEFTTKQLEKDYANAAYATIYAFVLKFKGFGLLSAEEFTNKVKYKAKL